MSVTGVSVLAGLVQYQQLPRCFLVSCGPSFCQHPAGYSRPVDSIPSMLVRSSLAREEGDEENSRNTYMSIFQTLQERWNRA